MNFYAIDVHKFNDKEYAFCEQMEQKTGEAELCALCGYPLSMREWLPPLKVKLSKPKYGDFVFGSVSPFLVSARFKKEYEASGMKGIKFFKPVEVVKISRKRPTSPEPPPYFFVRAVRSGAVDEERSPIVYDSEPRCDYCRADRMIKSMRGFILEEGRWGGEDIFEPFGMSGTIVVTEKFVGFIKERGLTNINFTPTEEFVLSYLRPWPSYT